MQYKQTFGIQYKKIKPICILTTDAGVLFVSHITMTDTGQSLVYQQKPSLGNIAPPTNKFLLIYIPLQLQIIRT